MEIVLIAVISFVLVFWLLILYSCVKVTARADKIVDAFLLGEGNDDNLYQ